MKRVYVIVEGQTERGFVDGPLAEFLWPREICVIPIVLGVPGHKGGRPNYARVEKDIARQLKQDRGAYCTTMIDFYGLGRGFPGTPLPPQLSNIEKVEHIERAVKADICKKLADFRPDVRFIPYLSLHEYEALLFSDSDALAGALSQPQLAHQFQHIRSSFPTPEDIDDSPLTAPSKRIIAIHSSYNKVIDGTRAARAAGIPRILGECPHFRNWLRQIEALRAA